MANAAAGALEALAVALPAISETEALTAASQDHADWTLGEIFYYSQRTRMPVATVPAIFIQSEEPLAPVELLERARARVREDWVGYVMHHRCKKPAEFDYLNIVEDQTLAINTTGFYMQLWMPFRTRVHLARLRSVARLNAIFAILPIRHAC